MGGGSPLELLVLGEHVCICSEERFPFLVAVSWGVVQRSETPLVGDQQKLGKDRQHIGNAAETWLGRPTSIVQRRSATITRHLDVDAALANQKLEHLLTSMTTDGMKNALAKAVGTLQVSPALV